MSDTSAPLSALFWWIIPITALTGAIIYVVWVTKFKAKFENKVDRSVGRFQRFQDSLAQSNGGKDASKNVAPTGAQPNGAQPTGAHPNGAEPKDDRQANGSAL